MRRISPRSLVRMLASGGAMLLLVSCSGGSPSAVGRVSRAIVTENGVSLNGVSLNGISLNGVSLNGVSLNGVSLNGVSLNGVSLNGVSLNGSQLTGIDSKENLVVGPDITGARLDGLLDNEATLPIRIDAVRQGEFPDTDVYFYRASFYADSGWHPLCGTDQSGKAIEAIFIPGRWDLNLGTPGSGGPIDDPGAFVPACVGKSIAKCVLLGYKPWAQSLATGVGLRAHHAACVRMLRADYCGDGISRTVTGTPINVHDAEGIQEDTEPWGPEAEWDQDGARCVNEHAVRVMTGGQYPACVDALAARRCASPAKFRSGTLLVSECFGCDLAWGGQ